MEIQRSVNVLFCAKNRYTYFEARRYYKPDGSFDYRVDKLEGEFLFTVEKSGGLYYAYHYEKSLEDYLRTIPPGTVKFTVGDQVAYVQLA